MKQLVFIAIITCLFSCKKEVITPVPTEQVTPYPLTDLVGHTWRRLIEVDDLNVHYYEFIHFKTDTTVGVYVASHDESLIFVPEIVYTCKITTKPTHDDSFAIQYPGDTTTFYTTHDVNVISRPTYTSDNSHYNYTKIR